MSGTPSETAHDGTANNSGRMAGEYRLGRKLGEGGFGTVYEAEHPVLRRRAAVKVLHKVAERDSEAVLRFVAEAQAVNQIRNRHIVDVFSFGKLADGRHFYVMDLLDGEPLDRFLKRAGKLEVGLVLQLLGPIADALDRAHGAGIVHRDLKPQNVFLSWDSDGVTVPVLLDFGVAKLLGDSTVQTVSGTPLGTPLYMPPEQARGEKVDRRADVYALGVLCHELLTGRPPITGETTIAVLMAHIVEAPPRVSEVCPELSPALDAPILAMLEKQADARPASAGAALRALAEAAESAGLAIPHGLPRLPRPPPMPAERPGELSLTVESTPPAPYSAGSAAGALPTPEGANPRRLQPFALGALVALAAIAAYVWSRSTPPAPAESAPAAVLAPPRPAAEPPAGITTDAAAAEKPRNEQAVPRADAPEAEPPAAPARRKKRAPPAGQGGTIPSDLENPF